LRTRHALEQAAIARANLTDAYLAGANLTGANLTGANLAGANLTDANLAGANLARANLARANLTDANLARANLTDAYLAGANLTDANLTGANLARANLTDANLAGANLAGAKGADLAVAKTRILPEGDLIGWKKCANGVIAKLRIPADARRSHAFGRKCRAEYADVLALFDANGKSIDGPAITNQHGPLTEYVIGRRVAPDRWDDDWQKECAGGIHFFITRDEAEAY
jgi:uncharacterized protein YjbI with pentapeptide repeats